MKRPALGAAHATALALLLVAPLSARGDPELEQAERLVATLTAKFATGASHGAGILVGGRGGALYIVTANHVVRRGEEKARTVIVRLRIVPGVTLEGQVLDDYDEDLDVGVIVVEGIQGQAASLADVPFRSLGAPERLQRGDELHGIGNPQGGGLTTSLAPFRFRERHGSILRFEAPSLAVGYSGGGLFDRAASLVGMLTRDRPPDGEATSISAVIDKLKGWGYPISLAPTPAGAVAAPIARPPIPAHVADGEQWDFGVPPRHTLISSDRTGPTPTAIPGGRVITTAQLDEILHRHWQDPQEPLLVFDVSGPDGPPYTLPAAALLYGAELGGDFRDEVQRRLVELLDGLTGGNLDHPMVFFCASPRCWNSYNAALRAINLGYRRVYWYRGGLWAWREAGISTFPAAEAQVFDVVP